MWLALIALSWSQDDWEVVSRDEHCTYVRAPGAGLKPLAAQCEVAAPMAELDALLSDFGAHQEIWESVAESTVVGQLEDAAGAWTLVRHVHAVPGISDRQMLLQWRRVEVEGGVRFEWKLAPEQPPVGEGRVQVGDNAGYYLLRRMPGGLSLEASFSYDPAGMLPEWLVKTTQAYTAEEMLGELFGKVGVE